MLRPGRTCSPTRQAAIHRAARVEDAVMAVVAARLRRHGWVPRVLPYTGYGGPGWVRVMARVLLGRPERTTRLPSRVEEAVRGVEDAVRGWRSFVTAPVVGGEVTVRVGDREHVLRTDRSGYVDAVLPADLPPGWHEVHLASPQAQEVSARVVVVPDDEGFGIVSDVDDTVMVTALPRPLLAAWNTFVLHEHARRPVPGMADLLRGLAAEHPGAPVLYLSTGAWNVAPTLTRFLGRHGFPEGPLLLTDWGPTDTGWFRDGRAHKRTSLARLTAELPHVRWLLVGDDGQHDPEIYGAFARSRPDHVRGVAVRQLSPTEQVLASGLPLTTGPLPTVSRTPWVQAPDGTGLAAALRQAGLLRGLGRRYGEGGTRRGHGGEGAR